LGPGEGTTFNVPLGRGYGDGEFTAIYQRLLVPVATTFRPELILVSAGFDIHADDPLGGMAVSPSGFAALVCSARRRERVAHLREWYQNEWMLKYLRVLNWAPLNIWWTAAVTAIFFTELAPR